MSDNSEQQRAQDKSIKNSRQTSDFSDPKEEPNDAREEKRLRIYGLRLENSLDGSLVVGPGKCVRLSGVGIKQDQPGLARLRPKDLSEVKNWIGVPDDLGAKRSCCSQPPAEMPGVAAPGDIRKLDPASQKALHDLANEYVNGDSRRVSAYKPILDHLVDRAVISGVFMRNDIEIHSGAVLIVDKDLKVLFARHIRIWRGGLLKLLGPTKIDCVSIDGNLLNLVATTIDPLPAFASYLSLEVANG